MTKNTTQRLTPKLRFPEFRDEPGWASRKVDELVDTVTPLKKLPTALYSAKGAFPIVDQSQDAICGWTDDRDAVIREGLPLIVFGDHTCILKLVDRPFAQGADGIKILSARPSIDAQFLYQSLCYAPVVTEEYKRHYSILKERPVRFPDIKTGEQHRIASCLSSLDDLIGAESQKLDALKAHKKGLMQQLFPREGETRPRLRFPEFHDAPGWEMRPLVAIAPLQRGFDLPSEEIRPGNVPIVYSNGPKGFHERGMARGPGIVTGRSGTIGKMHFVEQGDYWPHNTSLWVTSFEGHIPKFVFYLYESIGFLRFASGSGVPTLNRNDAHAFVTGITLDTDEQHRIASCLSTLDNLIAAQSDKLETLKTHKKGLMQQLFPSLAEADA